MGINWKIRIKNPIFWVQIVGAFILTALGYNSMEPQDLTTWLGLFNLVKGVFLNPYLLAICLWSVWNAINDPTTEGLSDDLFSKNKAIR